VSHREVADSVSLLMADNMPKWAAAPSRSGHAGLLLTAEALEGGDRTPESWHVDEKAAYMLGRNGQVVDICVAHKSASRVHACLAYDAEGELFLVDLGSAHGEQYCVIGCIQRACSAALYVVGFTAKSA